MYERVDDSGSRCGSANEQRAPRHHRPSDVVEKDDPQGADALPLAYLEDGREKCPTEDGNEQVYHG